MVLPQVISWAHIYLWLKLEQYPCCTIHFSYSYYMEARKVVSRSVYNNPF